MCWFGCNVKPKKLKTRSPLERIDIVVIDAGPDAAAAEHVQPAHRLHAGEHEDVVADVELLAAPRLLAARDLDVEVALAREVEAEAGVEEILVAVLDPVVAGLREHERADALQPEILCRRADRS